MKALYIKELPHNIIDTDHARNLKVGLIYKALPRISTYHTGHTYRVYCGNNRIVRLTDINFNNSFKVIE